MIINKLQVIIYYEPSIEATLLTLLIIKQLRMSFDDL